MNKAIKVRSIIYKTEEPSSEDYCWTARALEINISGFGSTQEDAVEDLDKLIRAQMAYAQAMNDPSVLENPAEPALFELWDRVEAVLEAQENDTAGRMPEMIDRQQLRTKTIQPFAVPAPA